MTRAGLQSDSQSIHEIIGIYANNEEIDIALADLFNAGFDSSQIGLVAHKDAIRKQLAKTYRETSDSTVGPARQMEFVGKRTDHSALASHLGGLGSLGSTATNNIVASRSVLVKAAKASATGEVIGFSTGLAVLNRLPAKAKKEFKPAEPLLEALEDDRLLLCISGKKSGNLAAAKLVLDFSDSIDEGVYEVAENSPGIAA